MVKQFSVFLENRPGRLANLVNLLTTNGIRMLAVGIAEAGNYGIVRCILDDDEKAMAVLRNANTAVNLVEVIILDLKDLESIVSTLEKNQVNIDYAYTMDSGRIVVKVDDAQKATNALRSAGLETHAKT